MSALVLKKFNVDPNAEATEHIEIQGRQAGITAFILSLMGIDPTTTLLCNTQRIEVTEASFFGKTSITIPLTAVTGIQGGYTKSKFLLFATIISLFLALSSLFTPSDPYSESSGSGLMGFGLFLVFAIVFFIFYALKKQMSVGVQNGGDSISGLAFSRSVIEGVDVDINKVNETVDLMTKVVLQAQTNKNT